MFRVLLFYAARTITYCPLYSLQILISASVFYRLDQKLAGL